MTAPRRSKGILHTEVSAKPPEICQSAELATYFGEAAVDVIAVHGLASKYERTWSLELKDGDRYHWLREKLGADVPHGRILGYEYPSEWYGDPVHSSLEECGAEFLRCVIRDRCHQGRPEMCNTRRKRPIIFIAHSFGGLVVKQAMVLAYQKWEEAKSYNENVSSPVKEVVRRAQSANYRDFLCSIAGIVFLGTPHRGSGFSSWAGIKMKMGSLIGKQTHQELIRVLHEDSEPLRKLQQEFDRACKDLTVLDIYICCYRETRELLLPPYIVVREDSAWLDGATNGALDANHMEMNKYPPGKDANYDKVISDIRQIFVQGIKSVSRRLNKWEYGSTIAQEDRNKVEIWLDPSRTVHLTQNSRYTAKLKVHQAAPYTCHWLQKHENFKAWESESAKCNVLWIYGKPGSGKSVLAAYSINYLRTRGSANSGLKYFPCNEPLNKYSCGFKLMKPTVLSYFCGMDQVHDKPRSLLGALIHQLLSIHNIDEMMFSTCYRLTEGPAAQSDAKFLVQLLQRLVSFVKDRIFIIVDGLDDNADGAECLQLLKHLASSNANIRLLIFSQQVEVLRNQFEEYFAAPKFCITDYSHEDIHQYTEQRAREILRNKPTLVDKSEIIIKTLQNGADGVFQWITATLHHLDNQLIKVEEVDDYLENLPTTLRDVYQKIFARVERELENEEEEDRFFSALQFLAISATPITVMDLQFALDILYPFKRNENEAFWDLWGSQRSKDEQERSAKYLLTLLDSLVEVDSNNFVTLVHSSLRKAILVPNSKSRHSLWYQFTEKEAHANVAQVCITICRDSTLAHSRTLEGSKPTLVEYAWNYWAYHLRTSGATLEDELFRDLFDSMLRRVHQETICFLGALAEFVTQPIDPVRGRYSIIEYRQSWQKAQDSLAPAIEALCTSRKNIPVAEDLQKAKTLVPLDLSDIPNESNYREAFKWLKSNYKRARNWLLRDETRVQRVNLDDLSEKTAIESVTAYPSKVVALLDASRLLRMVALRFAVNPIHTGLVEKAGGAGFSPVNVLVYAAQLLEEAASFPYWRHLPEMLDPAEAFLCSSNDPQAGPAKFVLQSVEWKRPSKQLAAELEMSERRKLLADISVEQGRQLRKLQEIAGSRWMMARFAVDVFDTDSWFQGLVANPLINLQIREKLLFLGGDVDMPTFLRPAATLDRHAPTTMRDAPVAEVVKAIPSMLRIVYVRYITSLLQVFAEVPRAGVVTHFIQLTVSQQELLEFKQYSKRFLSKSSLKRLWHIPLVVFLYWLRNKFWPSLGAHPMAHPWRDLMLAYRHSAAYLNLQSTHDAKFWFKQAMIIKAYNAVGGTFVGYSNNPNNPGVLVSDTFASFYQLLTLERNIFGLGFAGAILVASANVILYDRESLSRLGDFTFWFFVYNGFTVFNMLAGAMLQQSQASFLRGLGVIILEIVVFLALIKYEALALRIVYILLLPIIWPVMTLWKTFLYLYAPFMRACGVILFIFMVLLAVSWLNRSISDPHNLQGSMKAVKKAMQKAISMHDQKRRMYIGEYPLRGSAAIEPTCKKETQSTDESWDWPEDSEETSAKPAEQERRYTFYNPQNSASTAQNTPTAERPWIWTDKDDFDDDGSNSTDHSQPNSTSDASKDESSSETAVVKFSGAAADAVANAFAEPLRALAKMSLSSFYREESYGFNDGYGGGRMYNSHSNVFGGRGRRQLNNWNSGNGWRMVDPRTGRFGLHYHYSGPGTKWDVYIFGLFFAVIAGFVIWCWWLAWRDWRNGESVPVAGKPVRESCWHIRFPVGPIIVGYGCKGWFWEMGGYYDDF